MLHTGFRTLALAAAMLGTAAQAAPACFSKAEIGAAHLRALQQQFNVAALDCQTVGPDAPTFASHYNQFVQRFGSELAHNSEILKHHFARTRGGLDHWVTLLANDASSQVMNRPDFCQAAWDRLDAMIALEPAALESYAEGTHAAGDLAPACPEKVAAVRTRHHPKKKTPSN